MSLKLTREGAYGYISVLIAKSPNLVVLSNIVESSEAIDIQTALSRGILGPEYSIFLQAKTIDDAEDNLYNFYKYLLAEVIRLVPKPYDDYADCFVEIFDLDKAVSLIFSAEKQRLKLKHILSHIELLINHILYAKKVSDKVSSYISCLSTSREPMILNIIECFMRIYTERVIGMLSNVSKLEPVDNSLKVFYEFSLLRLYKYIMSSKLLKMHSVRLEDIVKEMRIPVLLVSKVVEDIKKLEDYVKKDLTLYTVYELRSIYDRLRYLLYTPHSFIDRLTYLLIHKFYEAMFIRYIVTHKYAWR